METFVNPPGNQPVTELRVKVGETKVVGLKLAHINGNPDLTVLPYGEDVLRKMSVSCDDGDIAFSRQVIKLAKSKSAYEDHYNVADIDTVYVEQRGLYFFQICGKKAGRTNLKAVVDDRSDYANPVPVVVTENPKLLVLSPPVPFTTLWNNHPLNGFDPDVGFDRANHPCPLPFKNQCMVRFCKALADSGVSFTGLSGSKCGGSGAAHSAHFTNPYDFINWKTSGFYSWTANPPLQSEPMPGLAAWPFMESKRGVVLFMHYFAVQGAMWGGHIDLWNRDCMGNNVFTPNSETGQGLGAFCRAQTIYFWPLE
jgi:type VI secretion system (T6SS) effector Tae4 (amidase)